MLGRKGGRAFVISRFCALGGDTKRDGETDHRSKAHRVDQLV